MQLFILRLSMAIGYKEKGNCTCLKVLSEKMHAKSAAAKTKVCNYIGA